MSFSNGNKSDRLQAVLGLGVISLSGLIMAILELRHIQKMSTSLGIAVFALLPFIVNLVLIVAVFALWRSQFDGREILRIAGWVVLGMVVVGLLATWTITHQNIRGRPFAHAPFVTVNNLSAGGLIGLLIGWYDGQRRLHRERAETARARLEFLHSSLRHNVLNGLNIILGNIDLLDEKVDDTGRSQLEMIRTRGEELTRFAEATDILMENFLGAADVSTRPIELSTAINDDIEKLRAQYDNAGFAAEIPAELYIAGDDFVSELFYNILSNAVIHNDKRTPMISVNARRKDGTVEIDVADNGPGIPDEQKERVLEWNVKGEDSAGTGLGLAIANTVAKRYGGSLWIEDNDPDGTVIKVELPAAESPATDGDGREERMS